MSGYLAAHAGAWLAVGAAAATGTVWWHLERVLRGERNMPRPDTHPDLSRPGEWL